MSAYSECINWETGGILMFIPVSVCMTGSILMFIPVSVCMTCLMFILVSLCMTYLMFITVSVCMTAGSLMFIPVSVCMTDGGLMFIPVPVYDRWWSGPWQHCSVTCGDDGRHKRTVICVRSKGPAEQIALDVKECDSIPKPREVEPCHRKAPCPGQAEWNVGQWTQVGNN